MADISTKYMGLDLKNPIIVGSCSLTGKLDKIKESETAGAGAVVLKSIFEEQILADKDALKDSTETQYHTEAWGYLERMGRDLSVANYLELVEKAKKEVSIPVIASLNCVTPGEWIEYAKKLENAGADALELNIYIVPRNPKVPGSKIEQKYVNIFEKVKDEINIPIALKIAPYFSNFLDFARELDWRKVDSLVIFNRYYPFDIDVEKMELTAGKIYSSRDEISLPLRWMSLLYGKVDCDLAATTGVHEGEDAIKQLLAGASAVQIASVLYQKGFSHIQKMLTDIESWMERHNFDALDEFRGKMSQGKSESPEFYERVQFIKAIVGIS